MFDDVRVAHTSLVWIETGIAPRAALAQQIPALIQIYLELAQALVFVPFQSALF